MLSIADVLFAAMLNNVGVSLVSYPTASPLLATPIMMVPLSSPVRYSVALFVSHTNPPEVALLNPAMYLPLAERAIP